MATSNHFSKQGTGINTTQSRRAVRTTALARKLRQQLESLVAAQKAVCEVLAKGIEHEDEYIDFYFAVRDALQNNDAISTAVAASERIASYEYSKHRGSDDGELIAKFLKTYTQRTDRTRGGIFQCQLYGYFKEIYPQAGITTKKFNATVRLLLGNTHPERSALGYYAIKGLCWRDTVVAAGAIDPSRYLPKGLA